MLVKNLTQNVTCTAKLITPADLYQLHVNNKLFYDRERLQRLLKIWHDSKINSYLSTAFNGASLKDCFQLAEIKPIVEYLKTKLVPNEPNYSFVEDNLKYFTGILEKGFEYLVLDGQHRIDTLVRYFNNEFYFTPENLIRLQVNGEKGTVDVKGKFDKLPEEIQNHLMYDIPLIVVVYQTGDLRELARIFITSNSMMAMTKHEKRILNYNPLNRWLNSVCLNDINLRDMFENIGKGMSSEYALENKGDTLFLAEMLLYINNNTYEGTTSNSYDTDVLDDVFGTYPKKKIVITESEKELTKSIMRIMSDGCVKYDKKKMKKFTKSSFYNLFYTISFLLQKGNFFSKKYDIDGKYKIINPELFILWFFNMEFARLNAPGSNITFKSPTGQTKNQKHNWSYVKHNEDQKHSRKESVANQGGSKYTFTSWARVYYLLEDLYASLTQLEKSNIISKIGSRTTTNRDEMLVAHNIPLSESDKFHINEIIPVSKGGNRVLGNTEALPVKQNLVISNRPRRTT